MKSISELRVKVFADGADRNHIIDLYNKPIIKGFTTNPTLMRKAGITDYKAFALEILKIVKDRPISFGVLSDDFKEMYRQALEISGWGKNVWVKIPITNTKGESAQEVIYKLAQAGVKQNVTALMTLRQVRDITQALADGPPAYLSIFAGRIADTGRDPMPMMAEAIKILRPYPQLELIWASPRELLNIFQADAVGCHIITATNDILQKLSLFGKDLNQYSLETVSMFYNDVLKAGYTLETEAILEEVGQV